MVLMHEVLNPTKQIAALNIYTACIILIFSSSHHNVSSSSRFYISATNRPTDSPYLAQDPISNFFAGPEGEISKSKMSIGRPMVVQALGICVLSVTKHGQEKREYRTSTIPATWPCTGAHDRRR